MQFETQAIKSNAGSDNLSALNLSCNPLPVPLLNQSSFSKRALSAFAEIGIAALEQKLAKLECAEMACLWQEENSSVWEGLLHTLPEKTHVLIPTLPDSAPLSAFQALLEKRNIAYSTIDALATETWTEGLTEDSHMLVLGSPLFSSLNIIDLSFAGMFARKHNLLLAVDNSQNSPYLQQPLKLGADVVIHSGHNFLSKQAIAPFGLIAGKKSLLESIKSYRASGDIKFSSFDLWFLEKSLETLHLRLERQSLNAQQMALCLMYNEKVTSVHYPFLPTHPQVNLARKQMKLGGAELSFMHKDGKAGAKKFLHNLALIAKEKPAKSNYSYVSSISEEGLIKLSAGLEHELDLCADLEKALSQS
ncbi:MAG: PLP-dependent transferase [Bacteroidota bacterium]